LACAELALDGELSFSELSVFTPVLVTFEATTAESVTAPVSLT
jgi:hypothetical protein